MTDDRTEFDPLAIFSAFSDNSPVRRLPDWVSMIKKSKVPSGTTEPCLFAGAPFVPEATVLKRKRFFRAI